MLEDGLRDLMLEDVDIERGIIGIYQSCTKWNKTSIYSIENELGCLKLTVLEGCFGNINASKGFF